MSEIFLLDSNTFITPYRLYYSFDFAPGYWQQLATSLQLDNVVVLDVVFKEVSKMEDELSTWIKNLNNFKPRSTRTSSILVNYGKVLNYVQSCGLYKDEALRNWSQEYIADPWLIAVAMDLNATIITEETPVGSGLSTKNPSRNAKLPDVAKNFGVKCKNLFYFMRQMNFKL